MKYKGTSMVVFDKSKITAGQINKIRETAPENIEFKENAAQFMVYDLDNRHPQYMAKVVDMLIKSVKQK